MRAIVTAASSRWAAASGGGGGGAASASASAKIAATRDLAASTLGVLEGVLGGHAPGSREDARERAAIDALARALLKLRVPGAGRFVVGTLLPNFLARELRAAPQTRCARAWLSALSLCRRLLEGGDGGGEGEGARMTTTDNNGITPSAVLAGALSSPAAALLDVVVGAGDVNHQAASAVDALFRLLADRLDAARGAGFREVSAAAAAATETSRVEAPAPAAAPAAAAAAATAAATYFPFPGGAAAATTTYFPFPSAPAAPSSVPPADSREPRRAAAAAEDEARRAEEETRAAAAKAAAAVAAASSAFASPATAKLLLAAVAAAASVLATAALSAPLRDANSAHSSRAFTVVGRRTPEDDRGTAIARMKAALAEDRERLAAELGAHARDVSRFDFGGESATPPLPPGALTSCEASSDNTINTVGHTYCRTHILSDGDDGDAWWGPRAIRRGSHRLDESWSLHRARVRCVSSSATAFLLALARSSGGGNGGNGGGAAGRAACGAALRAARERHGATLRRAAAILSEPDAAGCGPERDALSTTMRAMGLDIERLPPKPGGGGGAGVTSGSGAMRQRVPAGGGGGGGGGGFRGGAAWGGGRGRGPPGGFDRSRRYF